MAISFTPARINRGLIKKAAQQTGFMTSVLNRINTDRKNAREDARNKELDALKNRELDIKAMDMQRKAAEFAAQEERKGDEFFQRLDLDKMKREDAEEASKERIRVADEKLELNATKIAMEEDKKDEG